MCDGVFDSDHKQVECTVRHVKSTATLTSRQSAFNYKQADFQRLRVSLELLPWNILDLHVDVAVDTFYDLLHAVISDCIPVVHIKRNYPPWFDRDLRTLLREKETAFERMKRNRCEETEEAFRNKRRNFRNSANQKYSSYLTVEVFTGQIFSSNSIPPRKVGSKSIPIQIKKLMGHPTQPISK